MRIAAVAGILLLALATGAFAQPVTLKLASFEPPQAPITGGVLTPWANEVSAASGGTLKIDIYPGGTLGRSPLQQLKLVQDGVADITWTVPGYTPGRFDDTQVAELPFLVTDATSGSLAMTGLHKQGMLRGFDDIKLLLREKPKARGLAVPGLPLGAPGFEETDPSCEAGCTILAGDSEREPLRERRPLSNEKTAL